MNYLLEGVIGSITWTTARRQARWPAASAAPSACYRPTL